LTSGKDSSLEIFRTPARHKLIDSIKEIQHDPKELEPVIERAIDMGLTDVLKRKNHPKYGELPVFWIAQIHRSAFLYVKSVLTQDSKIDNLKKRIKSYKSIFIVGAGISFEVGIPFTDHLKDILKFVRCGNYDQLRLDNERCFQFKNKFKNTCDEKQPTKSHSVLSLNLGNKIIDIVCLNWDDLIERSAENVGKEINVITEENDASMTGGYLWKPHGDIRNIKLDNTKGKGGWVFPDEGGFIFETFLQYLKDDKGLRDSLFVIVIAGYSGNDKRINKIIKILEDDKRRITYRIGLDLRSLKDQFYIAGPSDYILPMILS
jgi:hypothetical protein